MCQCTLGSGCTRAGDNFPLEPEKEEESQLTLQYCTVQYYCTLHYCTTVMSVCPLSLLATHFPVLSLSAEDRKQYQEGELLLHRGQSQRPASDSPLSLSLVKAAAADSDSFTQLRD